MKLDLHELLEHNGYTLGTAKNIRKKTFRERLAEVPREMLEDAVKSSTNFNAIIDRVDGIACGNRHNISILTDALNHWGIDYSHITIGKGRPGSGQKKVDEGMLPEEVLDEFFGAKPRQKVSWPTMLRLIRDHNLLPNHCCECGILPKWNGKPMTLQVDHINGVRTDNRLENLRVMCPNCHSQTDTYCSKNRSAIPISAIIEAKKV